MPTPLHSQYIAHRGACGKTRVMPQNAGRGQNLRIRGHEVRVLLSACGSRGDVEPLAGLAVRWRALGAVAGTRRGGAGASDLRSELIT